MIPTTLVERPYPGHVFAHAPMNVYWEATLACGLACRHCRAEARPTAAPGELSTLEARALIDSVKQLGSMLIVTGGDPLERPDLHDLIGYARSLHVPVAVTPAVTPKLTRDELVRLKEGGIAALGLSLDAPTAEIHDGFRAVPGTFARTLEVLAWARELDLPVQINTTITTETIPHLPALYELLRSHAPPIKRWLLFALVPVGRGLVLGVPSAEQIEEVFAWMYRVSPDAPFHLGTVEAPHYRRYWIQRRVAEGATDEELQRSARRMHFGMRDGNGIVFVSHRGDVLASGFLTAPVIGSVRETPLEVLYRSSPVLQRLRNPETFHGPCGRCDYRWACVGSRARARATVLDPYGSDPLCIMANEGIVERRNRA